MEQYGNLGTVGLPVCGLPNFTRFSGELSLRTFLSLLLSPMLQQGELKETLSRKADFPVPFVGMTHLTDHTIRVFTLFFAASSKGCSKAKCPFIEMPSVQIRRHKGANLVFSKPICSGAKLVPAVATNLNTDAGA